MMSLPARLAAAAFWAVALLSPTAGAQTEARLIAGTSVRVRSAPSLDAPVVAMLRLGSSAVLQMPEQPRDTAWVKVLAHDALTMEEADGYIHASLTRRVTRENNRFVVGEAIAMERLARAGDDFAQRVELFDWVTRINREHEAWARPDDERGGRFALLQIRSTIAVIAAMPRNSEVLPYDGWVGRSPEIVERDSAGRVLIRAEFLDSLHSRHIETSSSDEIAWLAYQAGLPTGCHPSLLCDLSRLAARDAKYLRDHGAGRYATPVMKNVLAVLGKTARQQAVGDPFDPPRDCPALASSTATLRASIEGVAGTERDAALAALARLAGKCPAG